MIGVIRVCASCGAKISGDTARKACPACLLRTGLGLIDEDVLAQVVDPDRDDGLLVLDRKKSARPGESARRGTNILGDFGDFELLEEIGRGGQGVVYRAHQKSLNRTVALKVIGLGPWTTQRHLKRFRREAEAAASLEHPCIVPIYEVGERDAQCYFSMKFVDGGQLDEVVRRTPMPIRSAAELIMKVARTVHYAHEHGILHRDIKPGNILLDQNGEPHLTDFGLARLAEAESTVTATLDVLGTPSYMAPEQAAGEHTKVSKATDVYGLGAVLYQLLTGQPPFAGGTTYETIRLLRDTEARQPRLLNPKIDRDLSTICLKCLEKDPIRRYTSALALAEDLEHWRKHEPIRAKPSGFFTHGRKWVRRNPSTSVLVMLLVALAIGLSVTIWNRKPTVVIPKSLAVLPFENLSEDPNNAYFAEGMQEEILTRLAKIADLKVISRASTQRYHSKPANLAEIAKQLGVANVLEGSVQKIADHVRVNVQLTNAQTDSHLWAESYDRKFTDILGVESEIAKRIAESLQAKLTGHEEQALAAKPTNNPEAYDAYLRGLAFDARVESDNSAPDLKRNAISFYERAVQLDPNFALAWARLSRADAKCYFGRWDPRSAGRGDAAKGALENAQRLDPDSPETLLALGYYQYRVLRNYEAAKNAFARVSKMLPNSSEVARALAEVLRREGHWNESIAYFEQALVLDPHNAELLKIAADTYGFLRQFPAALKFYDRVLDIMPSDPVAIKSKAWIYQAEGKLHEAAKLLEDVSAQTDSQDILAIKLTQLRLERNFREATRLLQSPLTQFHSGALYYPPLSVALAFTQRLAGDVADSKVTAEQMRNKLKELFKGQPDNEYLAAALSQAYAMLGEKDSALKAAEQAIMLLPSAKDRQWGPGLEENLALIQATVGENSRAIKTLTQLLHTTYNSYIYGEHPITPALLRLDPLWDPLRGDPAFQKLCEDQIDRSVAVLPFENLSDDPNNAYFAEGIQEEILTRLSKMADLKVVSRTSTSRYKSKPDDIGEIAKQLGVANILEGSVQKANDQVRVNVQLINAETDSHVWADTYDRKLTDIFGVESEIAKGIATALQVELTSHEERTLAAKPTNNPEAYDAYLRGLAFEARSLASLGELSRPDLERKAISFYERAVQLDSNFAIAWARLCRAEAHLYHVRGVPVQSSSADTSAIARSAAAKRALENAQNLEPNSPETLLALGYYQYRMLIDYGAAKVTFARVRKLLPSSSEVPLALGRVARREGHWDESVAYFEQALALDPRDVELLMDAATTYADLRQFPTALKLFDRVLDIAPNDLDAMAAEASIYQAQGKLQKAATFLSEINEETLSSETFKTKITQLRLERNYGEAIRLVQTRLVQFHFDDRAGKADWKLKLALMQRLAGDTASAKAAAEQARSTFEQLYSDQPNNHDFAVALSQAYAALGEKDSALKVAQQAIALLPSAKDRMWGPSRVENLALIQTLLGESSRAIETLTQLLQTPYDTNLYSGSAPVTPSLLKLDPFWDLLRGDPAFQKLCEEKQP